MTVPALARLNDRQRIVLCALLNQAHEALVTVAPHAKGFWFDNFDDRSTWCVEFADGATDAERSAAAEFVKTWQPDWTAIPPFNPPNATETDMTPNFACPN